MKYCARCRNLGRLRKGTVRVGRQWFCEECFQVYVINQVKRTIEKYKLIAPKDKVYIGLSGGKDSAALCHILTKLTEEYDFSLKAFHINLGFGSYSEMCERVVREQAKICNIDLDVIKPDVEIKRYGNREICAVCGAVKRYLMNKHVREAGGTKIATAHTLEDQVLFLIKNYLAWHPEYMIKQYPYLPEEKINGKTVMVARIKPLFFVSEETLEKYVEIVNIPVVHEECPYRNRKRDLEREAIENMDNVFTNFKLLTVKNFLNHIRPILNKSGQYTTPNVLKQCKLCGEHTSTDICLYCRLKQMNDQDKR